MKLELVAGTITPDQMEALEHFNDVNGAAAKAWKDGQGLKWAARNPVDLEATDASFRERYSVNKSWAVRDALRAVPRTATWLEVGCSAGAHQTVMAAAGFAPPIGVEMSHDAMKLGGYVGRVAQADARYLPFGDLTFDGVTTAGSFMHFGPPDRMRACARELARVARRWWFLAELYSPEPHMVSFGELLPPVWLYPWHVVLPSVLGGTWSVYTNIIHDLRPDYQSGLRAPLQFLLLERGA